MIWSCVGYIALATYGFMHYRSFEEYRFERIVGDRSASRLDGGEAGRSDRRVDLRHTDLHLVSASETGPRRRPAPLALTE